MKKGKRISIVVLISVIILLSPLLLPHTFVTNKNKDYSSIMKDSIENMNAKVIDIGMLGAHDALTSEMNYGSKSNPNETGILTSKAVTTIGRGVSLRFSKAQKDRVMDLLSAGVRYLDCRITKVGDTYYTSHGFLSGELSYYLMDALEFLEAHPGEIIVFDIQYFYTENGKNEELSQEEYNALFQYIDSIKTKAGTSLLDYVPYDTDYVALHNLTYGSMTQDGTMPGAIFLAKCKDLKKAYYRDPDATIDDFDSISIRSLWHNTNSTKDLKNGIKEEYERLKDKTRTTFVVNQAQKTAFVSGGAIVSSLFQWSLLHMANETNKELVKNKEEFIRNLSILPIYMCDYSTSDNGDFNTKANEYIKEYNMSL